MLNSENFSQSWIVTLFSVSLILGVAIHGKLKKYSIALLTLFPAEHVAFDVPAIIADQGVSNPWTVRDVHHAMHNAPVHSLHMQEIGLAGLDHR